MSMWGRNLAASWCFCCDVDFMGAFCPFGVAFLISIYHNVVVVVGGGGGCCCCCCRKRWYDADAACDYHAVAAATHQAHLIQLFQSHSRAGTVTAGQARWDERRWCSRGKRTRRLGAPEKMIRYLETLNHAHGMCSGLGSFYVRRRRKTNKRASIGLR